MADVSMSIAVPPRSVRIPLAKVVWQAYAAALGNLGIFVQIAWFWCLVLVGVQILSHMLLPAWMTDPAEIKTLGVPALLLVSVAGYLNAILLLPMLASIAVNWHRFLLLNEKPSPWAFARLDGTVWSYVLVAAGITAIRSLGWLPAVLTSLGGMAPSPAFGALHLASVALIATVMILLPRLSLSLPAVAVGDSDLGFVGAFRAGKGNTLRLGLGALACVAPALFVGFLTFAVWPGHLVMMSHHPLANAIRVAESMMWPFVGIVFVGYLSYSYQFFCANRVAALKGRPG